MFTRFFQDAGRILRDAATRRPLLGLAYFLVLLVGVLVVLREHVVAVQLDPGVRSREGVVVTASLVLGCLLSALQRNTSRKPGLVPLGATGFTVALGWAALVIDTTPSLPLLPSILLGVAGTLPLLPLWTAYLAALPEGARLHGMVLLHAVIYLPSLLLLVLWSCFGLGWPVTAGGRLGVLCLATAVGAILSWCWLVAPAIELMTEWALVLLCRIRIHGPGKDRIPLRGPLIIVGNHSAYLDPFWVGKIVPRHTRPMMTSTFYDLPVVHWLMVHVVQAIRVPAATFRRDAPELREAVAALRRGDCLLIFPEGQLRKKQEQILRHFGQGIWRILHELPETPVLVVWIEGGWGSWTSHDKGPPLKNKPLDWRRRIDIALAEPQPLPAEVLADQRATRAYLMRACLECRRYLGLDVPAGVVPGAADWESGANQEQPGDEAHEINS